MTDQSSYFEQQANSPASKHVRDLLKYNPNLAQQPQALKALQQRYGINSSQMGVILNQQALTNKVDTGGILHGVKNFFGDAYGTVKNWFDPTHLASNVQQSAVFNPRGGAQAVEKFGKAAAEAVVPTGKGVLQFAGRAGQAVANLESGDLSRAITGAKEVAKIAGETALAPRTFYSALMSDAKRNGWAVALGHVVPAAVLAATTGKLINAATGAPMSEFEAGMARNAAAKARDEAIVNSTSGGASTDEMVNAAGAAARLKAQDPLWLARQELKNLFGREKPLGENEAVLAGTKNLPRIQELSKMIREADAEAAAREASATKRAFGTSGFDKSTDFFQNVAGKMPGMPIQFARGIMRGWNTATGGTFINALALIRNPATMTSDPEVWKYALEGKVVDANGKVTTLGGAIADALNAPQGMFHDALAKFLDIDFKYLAKDPFVKAFDFMHQGRTYAGFTGTLNRVWGGLGITTAGDFTRAYGQYSSVRRAIDFIAKSNPAQILGRFGGMFSARMLTKLGEANTPAEVLSVLEDSFKSAEFLHSTAPTLSWYSGFKAALSGSLGAKFGTLGRLLESDAQITPNIVEQVKKETGYDITPSGYNFQKVNAAGKLKVSVAKRIRDQFVKTPEWYNKALGKMTNRDIVPGSIEAVEGIMNMLRAVHESETTVLSVGDLLIKAAADPAVYRSAYRSSLYEIIMRPVRASMPQVEYQSLEEAIGKDVWEMVDRMAGADGGGNLGAYVASADERFNEIMTPEGIKRAGIGSTHLGMLKLPRARDIMEMQRTLGNLVTDLRSYGADKALNETRATLEQIVEQAEFTPLKVESLLRNLRKVLTTKRALLPETWESDAIHSGYVGKFSSMLKRYEVWLADESLSATSRAEKIALVVKDVSDEAIKIRESLLRLSLDIQARFNIVPPTLTPAGETLAEWAARNGVTEESILTKLDQLRGEGQAVEDMLAQLNAHLNTAPDAASNISDLAKQIASMIERTTEARKDFIKKFKAEWEKAYDDETSVLVRINKKLGGSGKRGLRNNYSMIADAVQQYNNKYFKPMTLSSPGWAFRVSMSEAMLNSFRMGGMNMFEAHLASSLAKHEFRMAERFANGEKAVLRNALASTLMGIERGILQSMANEQKTRLINDALDLFMDHDGHLPMGMSHGTNDMVTNESVENMTMQLVHGTNDKSEVTSGYYYRGENFTTVNGNDAGAGTALHEAINRIYNDSILNVAAKFLHNEAQRLGSLAFAESEGKYSKAILDEAVARIEKGSGAKAWAERNKIVDDLRKEVAESAEFKAMNEAERDAVLRAIDRKALDADTLVTEDLPRYLRKSYDSANRAIVRLEESGRKLDADITAQEALVSKAERDYLDSLTSETSSEMRQTLGEQLDEADRTLRLLHTAQTVLDGEIKNHPFRRFYTILEHGAALDPYKPILGELRQKLAGQISYAQESTAQRIQELLGKEPVVLPRGGFAEMGMDRMMVFRDAAGNPVPNEAAYRQIFEEHPELWSDNESYSNYLPFGMPGVDGRDFLSVIGNTENIAELQRLVRYDKQLQSVMDDLAARRYNKAYNSLVNLDPTSVSEFTPLLTAGATDMSKATAFFNVDGVPPELVLGHGRTQEKTLADLALHVQQERNLRPTMFDSRFYPHYDNTEAGEQAFKADFDKYMKFLSSDKATIREKETAAKWFTQIVGPDPETWVTTANKVWKKNIDAARAAIARKEDRKGYYELLAKRKELSAECSRVGVEKREALKREGAIPEIAPEQTAAEAGLAQETQRLESLYAQRTKNVENLQKAHGKRDQIEEHVLTQDKKYRERMSKQAMKAYDARIASGMRGVGKLMRRINARTETLNARVQREVSGIIDEIIAGSSSKAISENIESIRMQLVDYMYAHLKDMPPEELARYERAHYPSANDTTGDPLLDWSNAIAEHVLTLTSGFRGTFFPEIAAQMATGDGWGPQKMAMWLSQRAKNGEDYVTNIPARPFISPLAKGSRSNLLINLSDKMHSKILGPIVNELVREPLFVLEYHKAMEALRVKVAQRLLTEDQAKIEAKVQATLNMNQFVHDPMGKTVWENNMRVLAPYYFAKNQALRRAMRLAGTDMGAFYRYMKMNLAITSYVGQNHDGSNTFVVPGSEAIGSLGTGISGMLGRLLGYNTYGTINLGFDANPASLMSVVTTGIQPGIFNIAREMIAVPFGPAVVMPLKFLYEYAFHKNPIVEHILSLVIPEASLRTSFVDDLMPNPLIRNVGKGIYGMTMQNNPSAYASVENVVLQDKAQQLYEDYYAKTAEQYKNVSSEYLKSSGFGSKEQLWSYIAGTEFSKYMNDPTNYQKFLDEANIQAGVMWTLKSLISYSSPVALSLGERFTKNAEFKAIMEERDPKTGELLYPTYVLAADEFAKRYPNRVFDLISRTKSMGARWPETKAALDLIEKHYGLLGKYQDAMAYLVGSENQTFDSTALMMEYAQGLRQRQTPKEFMKSLNVALGWRWYNAQHDRYASVPDNIDPDTGDLTYQAAMQLRRDAMLYGQTTNNQWWADKNAGTKNAVAYKTFEQMKQMVEDKDAHSAFSGQDLDAYRQLVNLRKNYVEIYKQAVNDGEPTGALRSQWYDYCTQLSTTPGWNKYSTFVISVLRNLPAPQ